jgi:hypothetical protein
MYLLLCTILILMILWGIATVFLFVGKNAKGENSLTDMQNLQLNLSFPNTS